MATAPVLVAMAGLQGAGKSTVAGLLAARLDAALVSVDPLESALARAGLEPSFERGLAAYLAAEEVARMNLALRHHVVVDAANYVPQARAMWTRLAELASARCVFVDVVCSDEALHRNRLEARRRGLAGFDEVTWAQVERRRGETAPWGDEARLRVDTASRIDLDAVTATLQDA